MSTQQHESTPRTAPSSAAYAAMVARQFQENAESAYLEANGFRRQIEAFSSQLSASQASSDETLLGLQVDLAIFRQRIDGIERRLARLEQVDRALRGELAPPSAQA